MDTRALAAVLALASSALAAARALQAAPGGLEELRTPASPAFVLLDLTPSAVERPTPPKALAASLLAATGDLRFLPRNYAIDVAPYWLAPHPTLTYQQFHNPGLWQRSEERRVGKEGRFRWSPDHLKKKKRRDGTDRKDTEVT